MDRSVHNLYACVTLSSLLPLPPKCALPDIVEIVRRIIAANERQAASCARHTLLSQHA